MKRIYKFIIVKIIFILSLLNQSVYSFDYTIPLERFGYTGYIKDYVINSTEDKMFFITTFEVRVLNLNTFEYEKILPIAGLKGEKIALSKDEKYLVVTTDYYSDESDSTLIYDLESYKVVRQISGAYLCDIYSDTSNYIICISDDKYPKIMNYKTGEIICTASKNLLRLSAGYHPFPDGSKILFKQVTYDNDKYSNTIFDCRTGESIENFIDYQGHLFPLIFFDNQKKYFCITKYDSKYYLKAFSSDNYKSLYSIEKSFQKSITHSYTLEEDSIIIISSYDLSHLLLGAYNINNLEFIRKYEGHSRGISHFDIDKKRKRIISCSIDSTIKFWNIETAECLKTIKLMGEITYCQYLENTDRILVFCQRASDNRISLLDGNSGEVIQHLKNNNIDEIHSLYAIDNPNVLVSTSDNSYGDYAVKVWDRDSNEELYHFSDENLKARVAKISGDGQKIIVKGATRSSKKAIWLYDINKQSVQWACSSSTYDNLLGFTEDCSQVVDFYNRDLIYYNVLSGEEVKRVKYETGIGFVNVYINEKNWILTPYGIYRTDTAEVVYSYESYISNCKLMDVSTDYETFIVGKTDSVVICDFKTGEILHKINYPNSIVESVRYSNDGSMFLTAITDGYIYLYKTEDYSLINTYNFMESNAREAIFSPDDRKIYAAYIGGNIKAWSTETIGVGNIYKEKGNRAFTKPFVYSSQGKIYINHVMQNLQKFTFYLYQSNGRLLMKKALDGDKKEMNVTIPLLKQNGNGFYFYSIKSKQKCFSGKILTIK